MNLNIRYLEIRNGTGEMAKMSNVFIYKKSDNTNVYF